MVKLSLGATEEEKKATYDLLMKKSVKWAKVLSVLFGIAGAGMACLFLSAIEGPFVLRLLIAALALVIAPYVGHWYGQILFYGYLFVGSNLSKSGITAGAVASAAGASFLTSYLVGGRRAVKTMGILWLVIIGIVVTVGVYAGLYYYVKFQAEAKKLGCAKRLKMFAG